MTKYQKTVRGRNPQLGNSLISLGPHGGINYEFKGTKDSYGLHKKRTYKVYSSNNRDEWQKYNQTIEERKRKKEIEAKLRSYKHYVKKAGTKRKYNLWPEIIIDVFYYHKKNTISKYDLPMIYFCLKKLIIVIQKNVLLQKSTMVKYPLDVINVRLEIEFHTLSLFLFTIMQINFHMRFRVYF